MKPNDSAQVPTFFKLPLGTILLHGIVFMALMAPATAQTRLNSAQVAALKGDVQGAFSKTVLRDFNSATGHGDGMTNAIRSAITDCGTVITCSITIPGFYGTSEVVPGYQLTYDVPTAAGITSGNISIFDHRYGEGRMFINNSGYISGLVNTPSGWVYNYYSQASQNAQLSTLLLRQWSIDGGNNQQNSMLSYADKTTWAGLLSNEVSHTPGQHLNLALGTQSTSTGDIMGFRNTVSCYGGWNAPGDLGCRAIDNVLAQGNVEYSGTLTGTPHFAATSLSVSATQGAYTQGAGRFLVKTSGGTISGGTIAGFSIGSPSTVSGTGTAWPVSSAIAQLGTNIYGPGVVTVLPTNFNVGSMAALSTSSLVCVADQESFEMLYPSAVTATSFTANFAKIHPSYAIVSTGGVCGYLLDLTADDVTNATFPNKTQTITGTLHFAWPLIASTAADSASIWVTGGGSWQSLVSRWKANTNNGYLLYPFAEVTSTQQSGGLSDTLTVGPNGVNWSAGDSVSEFLYPSVHHTFGNNVIESYYPNISPATAFGFTYNAPLQGFEAMMALSNNAPLSMYSSNGGTYDPPEAIRLGGETSRTISVDQPGDKATFAVGCTSCDRTGTIIAAGNAAYYDFWWYDQANLHWAMSANAASSIYFWTSTQFGTPFSNTFFGLDISNNGYIGTQAVKTATAANTDLTGELVISNATTATQSWQGAYSIHPECVARSQTDMGATNRVWISYSASSFTINFAMPVSGVVNYSCIGRN